MIAPSRLIAVGALVAGAVVVVAFAVGGGEEPIEQPISFNHTVHIDQEGLECVDCHVHVEELPRATIPTLEVCENCHSDEPMSESEQEGLLAQYISEGKEVPWHQIYTVPDHVYFSHRRHVVLGEVPCSSCHGDVETLTAPAEHPLVEQTMEWCMDCHSENKITNDCLACHR